MASITSFKKLSRQFSCCIHILGQGWAVLSELLCTQQMCLQFVHVHVLLWPCASLKHESLVPSFQSLGCHRIFQWSLEPENRLGSISASPEVGDPIFQDSCFSCTVLACSLSSTKGNYPCDGWFGSFLSKCW